MNEFESDLEPVADRLERSRPVPRAGFRAELRAGLLTASRRRGRAPSRLRLLVATQALSGAVLLAVVAVGVAGAGPLAS